MIEVRGLGKAYGDFHALRGVDFVIGDGEFVSIIGPSGCGKTTLLKILAGLTTPTAGEVLIEGRAVKSPGPERAVVFQTFVLLPWADVLTNAAFGLEARGLGKAERTRLAREQLRRVGLESFEEHYPHQISGGMQQRVGLARALAVDPRILLMDEPFGALDAQTRHLLQDDLLQLWQEDKRKTTIFITHSMEEAVYLSDRVLLMDTRPGRIQETIEVDLPRPRDASARRTPEFIDVTSYIWERLRDSLQEPTAGAGR
ncbi:MAG: ATP-binding cassette domain-containing protein [Nitriliruptorales bacterium]|nr:ATP-binding cassette domain-containing protein [Nitriliruptorales bacterium]